MSATTSKPTKAKAKVKGTGNSFLYFDLGIEDLGTELKLYSDQVDNYSQKGVNVDWLENEIKRINEEYESIRSDVKSWDIWSKREFGQEIPSRIFHKFYSKKAEILKSFQLVKQDLTEISKGEIRMTTVPVPTSSPHTDLVPASTPTAFANFLTKPKPNRELDLTNNPRSSYFFSLFSQEVIETSAEESNDTMEGENSENPNLEQALKAAIMKQINPARTARELNRKYMENRDEDSIE